LTLIILRLSFVQTTFPVPSTFGVTRTPVFYAVDIHDRILRKIIFNMLFIFMNVVKTHGEDIFETLVFVSFIQKKQTIIPISYTPNPLQLVAITKKGLLS